MGDHAHLLQFSGGVVVFVSFLIFCIWIKTKAVRRPLMKKRVALTGTVKEFYPACSWNNCGQRVLKRGITKG